jgi:hypothetical protein
LRYLAVEKLGKNEMKISAAITLAIVLGLASRAPASGQQLTQPTTDGGGRNASILLRDSCVALERREVAKDANDFSHLKDTDWASAMFCQGFIQGFETGANHTVYVLSEPKRLEILTSQPTIRQIAKAVVAYVDERPDEADFRNILLGGLQKAHAVVLFGNIKLQDLTPNCKGNIKDMPAGGCIYSGDVK